MSNRSLVKSKISQVDAEILKKILKALSEEEGIEWSECYTDFYGKEYRDVGGRPMIGALKTKDAKRGIGVGIDKDGKLVFGYDDYGNERAYERLKKLIENSYIAFLCSLLMKKECYRIKASKKESAIILECEK